jgi:lantibiotic leader peptide-processing serine protease
MNRSRLGRTSGLLVVLAGVVACGDTDVARTVGPDNVLASRSAAAPAPEFTGQFVILLRNNVIPADLAGRIEAAGGRVLHTLPQVGIVIAEGPGSGFPEAVRRDSRVQSVGLDPVMGLPEVVDEFELGADDLWEQVHAPTPADDLYNVGWVWGVNRVKAPAAWARGVDGTGVVIGILDTGIATNHPDLQNVVFNACYSSEGDVVGRHWQPGDPCSPYPDAHWHGTHVAGTAAAVFGGGRVVGVAPEAGLANYNVFEIIPGLGVRSYTSSRWRAMLHAADHGVDVINMSLGSFTFIGNDPKKFEAFGLDHEPTRQNGLATFLAAEKRVADYLLRKGTVIVSSAGNSGWNLNGAWIASPGQTQGHITVGATGYRGGPPFVSGISADIRAPYSNHGAAIDVVAPGGDCGPTAPACIAQFFVLSTYVVPGTTCAETRSCGLGYAWATGTSMAAPHVAGVVALAKQARPGLSALQVNNLIRRTTESLRDRQQFGHGMVDADAASQ